MLLVFLLLGAAGSLALCLHAGWGGLGFALRFVLLTLAGFLAAVLVYVLLLTLILLFTDGKKEVTGDRPFFRFLLVQSVGLILFFCGIRVRAEGLDQVPEDPFLLVGNHRSGFDPMVAIWALRRRRINFISKPSNFRIPYGGPLMRRCGFLAIDREDDRKALRTILAAADWMRRGEGSIGVYPEGTRSHTDELLPFRSGCFKAAQRAGVPIVVAATRGSGAIAGRTPLRPTRVTLRICGVIPAAEAAAKKTAELSTEVRAMLEQGLA